MKTLVTRIYLRFYLRALSQREEFALKPSAMVEKRQTYEHSKLVCSKTVILGRSVPHSLYLQAVSVLVMVRQINVHKICPLNSQHYNSFNYLLHPIVLMRCRFYLLVITKETLQKSSDIWKIQLRKTHKSALRIGIACNFKMTNERSYTTHKAG